VVGFLITRVFLFGSVWVGFDCNVALCGVSLGERVWCLAGTLLVSCLEVMLIFSCVLSSHAYACPTHPFFSFPQCVSVGGLEACFLGARSNDLFGEAWSSQLRCLHNMMDKFILICTSGARSFFCWKARAKGIGLHSWFSGKGNSGLCVA